MAKGSRIAVTGATGFVGKALCTELAARGLLFTALDRSTLAEDAALASTLAGVGAVIHLAGLAHRTGGNLAAAADYFAVNADLPVRLAEAAARAGVARFVHVSTVHVIEHETKAPLSPDMPVSGVSAYARSKIAAEKGLRTVTGIETVILRPALVYAPDAKGNLQTLMKLASAGLPLPFAAVDNRRDMIGRANLVDALIFLAHAPDVAGRTFHICDGAPLSLARLITLMRAHLGQKPRLFPVPGSLLSLALKLALGETRTAQLLGDFPIDDSALRAAGWTPPHPAGYDYLQLPHSQPAKR